MAARQPRIRDNWRIDEIAAFQGMDAAKAEKKLRSINEGGNVAQAAPPFPRDRSCNDCGWVIIFAIMILAVGGIACTMEGMITGQATPAASTDPAYAAKAIAPGVTAPGAMTPIYTPTAAPFQPAVPAMKATTDTSEKGKGFDPKNVKPLYLALATIGGSAIALISTAVLVFMSAHCATCVVWTSLLFSAAMMIVMGFALIAAGLASSSQFAVAFTMGGFLLIALGICYGSCVLCCWRDMIAFTAAIVEVCGEVTLDNIGMFFVAVVGATLSAAWSIVVALALDGVFAAYNKEITSEKNVGYGVFASFFFCWIWGCMVCSGVCYTSFCGVFGRWYYSDEEPENYESGVITSSFCAASTTSLGSVCFGTFLVAIIRTAEQAARMVQEDAMKEGNVVVCMVMCCIRCILDCIGDIVEYFNEWAFVQCAIRNTSFCESAKVVYSLCTVANIWALWATLLIDSVVGFGSFIAGVTGAIAGAGIGYLGSIETCMLGALCGFIAGNTVGWCCMSIFSAGAKTLSTCWAENPGTLLRKHQDETDIGHWFQEKASFTN